ncbi:hypothetical protein CHELA17_50257 [Chelatococcus asaccharovorans]|nr:hypothetical protein CHELA17_50257 [Chelatococcus asaccharovorans]
MDVVLDRDVARAPAADFPGAFLPHWLQADGWMSGCRRGEVVGPGVTGLVVGEVVSGQAPSPELNGQGKRLSSFRLSSRRAHPPASSM